MHANVQNVERGDNVVDLIEGTVHDDRMAIAPVNETKRVRVKKQTTQKRKTRDSASLCVREGYCVGG